MTLSGLHHEFLRHCDIEKRLAAQTVAAYRSDFAQFLACLLHGRPAPARQDSLRAFTTAGLRDYQRHMASQGWRTNTLRRRLVELGCFGAWLVDRGYLQRNPVRALSVPKRERHLPRVLEWHQAEAAVAGEPNPQDRAILALLAFAGLRRGEVMAASVGDYSRESRSLRVRGKGSKDRVVPLHVVAVDALDTYLASRDPLGPRDPLFASWRGRIGKRPIINAVARAGRSPRHPDAARARVARDHGGLHPRQPRSPARGGGPAGPRRQHSPCLSGERARVSGRVPVLYFPSLPHAL